MPSMQRPTCTNVRIRSTHDAHKIFYAVQRGILPMLTRRLDADERLALRSGCVYVWEERGPHTEITGLGIERFTEGRRWSPSRIRDEFLFYYEKYTPPVDDGQNGRPSDKYPPRDWDPLVKQTYSVSVETDKGMRKWHLTAYFTQATVDQLGTIDSFPAVGGLVVPEGVFRSTRVGKNRKTDDSRAQTKCAQPSTRSYAPFPSSYNSPHHETTPPSQPHPGFEPYAPCDPGLPYYSTDSHPQYPVSPQYVAPRSSHYGKFDPDNGQVPPSPAAYVHHDAYDRQQQHMTFTRPLPVEHVESQRPPNFTSPPFASPHPDNASHHCQVAIPVTLKSEDSFSQVPSYSIPRSFPQGHSSLTPTQSELQPSYPLRLSEPLHTAVIPPGNFLYASGYYPGPARDPSFSEPQPNHLDPHYDHNPRASIVRSSEPFAHELTEPAQSCDDGNDSGNIGPYRNNVGLAPLAQLQRAHPYRRDPVDDNLLRRLNPRTT